MPHIRISKFLSYVLRHHPEAAGLTLGEGGWVDVEALLAGAEAAGIRLDRALLEEVVQQNNKQRFAFSEDGLRIRANQGHSVAIDLALTPVGPPDWLYHGTAQRYLPSIRAAGLLRGRRHHVHLSPDAETAGSVGRRHGKPVVLEVAAGAMHTSGFLFYRTANGVWLTEHVPPAYLDVLVR